MRITSELWVKAFLRRIMAGGNFATVVRHGDNTAGAIFIKVIRRDRMALLFGPAHSGFVAKDGGRAFTALLDGSAVDETQVDDALEREQRFDGDLWVIEVESPDGDPMLGDELSRA